MIAWLELSIGFMLGSIYATIVCNWNNKKKFRKEEKDEL